MPDWNEDQLSLGRPAAMDTPTLIEWIERQLETPEEADARRDLAAILTPNERREIMRKPDLLIQLPFKKTSDEIFQQALDAFRGYNGNVMYVDKGVTVTPVDPNPEIIEFSRRKRDQ